MPDMKPERNKQLVHRDNEETWNKGNLALIEELYSPDFVQHFLPDGTELRGLEALKEHVRSHREAFPDWTETIEHIVAEGDLVVIHFRSTGTNRGSFLGNPPTGKRVRIHEMSIVRIVDGKIAEQWLLPNLLGLTQQLGITARPD